MKELAHTCSVRSCRVWLDWADSVYTEADDPAPQVKQPYSPGMSASWW